jgi:DegV family protein with EDD domain
LQNGEDIIYVHFSSQLSGTFEFMNMAINELLKKYPQRTIKTVDTKNISLGAGLIAYEAALLHNKGASDDEVVKFVEKFREEVKIYFMVDSLQHLKRGGRISATQAVIGGMLGVKPILSTTKDGKLVSVGKASGVKKAISELIEKLKTEGDVKKFPIGILHADALSDALLLKEKVEEVVGNKNEIWVQEIGPTVGTHCGPGTLGITFHSKKM